MFVHVLGTAAGGGYPQWNCACRLCRRARSSPDRFPPRLHASLAFGVDRRRWYLVNATPDVRFQIESFTALQPGPDLRHTPICGVLLTDAELDHTLGLFMLREGAALDVYGTAAVLGALRADLPVERLIAPYAQFRWHEVNTGEPFLLDQDRLQVTAIRLGTKRPRYVASAESGGASHDDWVVGYRLEDRESGGAVVYAPGVERWTSALDAALDGADAIFLDGTFWSEDEMALTGAGTLTARQMGHVPVSGPGGTAERLRPLAAKDRIYVHINNTNPVLDSDSAERRMLEDWGLIVGSDGMDLEV